MTLFLMKFNTKKCPVVLGAVGAPWKRTPYPNPNIKMYQLIICGKKKSHSDEPALHIPQDSEMEMSFT